MVYHFITKIRKKIAVRNLTWVLFFYIFSRVGISEIQSPTGNSFDIYNIFIKVGVIRNELLLFCGCYQCEPGHEKMCLMSYANNKGADQPAHPRSLISAFVVRCLDSVMSLVSVTKISSLMLASVAEQASLSLTWSETPGDTFSHDETHVFTQAKYSLMFVLWVFP